MYAERVYNMSCRSKFEISHVSQNHLSITDYFIDFKCVWNELVNYDPYPEYSCGAMKILDEKNDYDYVMRFLMGLNENYSTIRSKVLMSNPIPDINQINSLVIQEQRQKSINNAGASSGSNNVQIEATALYLNFGCNGSYLNSNSNGGSRFNSANRGNNCKDKGMSTISANQVSTIAGGTSSSSSAAMNNVTPIDKPGIQCSICQLLMPISQRNTCVGCH